MERSGSFRLFARLFVLVALLTTCITPPIASAHDDDLGSSSPSSGDRTLDGTWRLVSPELRDGRTEFKTIGGGRFIWYVIENGRIVRAAGGRMQHQDGLYLEWIECSNAVDFDWMVGATGRFTVDLHDGQWRHRGSVEGGPGGFRAAVDEVWERVNPTP